MKLKIISVTIEASRFHNVLNTSDETNLRVYGETLLNAKITGTLKVKCIFPGCRKENYLTGFVVGDKYCAYPLYGYNGRDELTIEEYNSIVQSAEVNVYHLLEDGNEDALKDEELTEEIIQALKDNDKIKANNN